MKASDIRIAKSVQDIGDTLSHARKKSGLPTRVACASAGVSTRFLSQVENGKETAQAGKLLHVLSQLGISVILVPTAELEKLENLLGHTNE